VQIECHCCDNNNIPHKHNSKQQQEQEEDSTIPFYFDEKTREEAMLREARARQREMCDNQPIDTKKFRKNFSYALPYEICDSEHECLDETPRLLACERLAESNQFSSSCLSTIPSRKTMRSIYEDCNPQTPRHENEKYNCCIDSMFYTNREIKPNEQDNSTNGTITHASSVEYVSIYESSDDEKQKTIHPGFDKNTPINVNQIIVPQMRADGSIIFTKNNSCHNFFLPNVISEIDLDADIDSATQNPRNFFDYNNRYRHNSDFTEKERMDKRYLDFITRLEKAQRMDDKFETYVTLYSMNAFPRYKKPKHIASVDWILFSTCSISKYIQDCMKSDNFSNGKQSYLAEKK
jgi:hypothetical protein